MDQPNVLFIHTDQHRWDALGANGNDEIHTPNLDRLAENGVNFTQPYVNAPVCMPSRESCLTGKYPSELRIFENGVSLPENVRTMPEYFGESGYRTANIGKLHFLPHAGRDHTEPHPDYGFDHLEISDEPGCYEDAYRAWVRKQAPEQLDEISVGLPPAAETYQSEMGAYDDIAHPENRFPKEPVPFEADADLSHSAFVGRRTSSFLRENADDRFLCVAGFYSPHSPWVVPQRFLDLYDRDELSVPEFPPELERERAELAAREGDDPTRADYTDAELRAARHGYYAMVSEVDHWVGEIMATLDELGLREETLVVFTADHGEDLGDHLRYGKGFPGWDSISRVPLLVHWPDGVENPGRTEDGIVELVDLLPTLLDAAGLRVPRRLQGESLAPALNDDAFDGRSSALLESSRGKALRTDQYRYAIHRGGDEFLYDLETDPTEHHDVSTDSEYEDALASCRKQLLRRVTEVDIASERPADWQY